MKTGILLAVMGCAFLLAGCEATMKPNPEFRNCANACTKRQDSCMVNASTAADVSKCNSTMSACVSACEARFPRYIKP